MNFLLINNFFKFFFCLLKEKEIFLESKIKEILTFQKAQFMVWKNAIGASGKKIIPWNNLI